MSKNRLYTLSYFRKRLFENEINSAKIIDQFSENDPRQWCILIDPKKKNFICTCYKLSTTDFWFSIQTKEYSNYSVRTFSMEVVIDTLKALIEGNQSNSISI